MKINFIMMLTSVALITACATTHIGQDFKDTNLSQLQSGKTTLDQTITLLGTPPSSSMIGQSGATGYTWTYIQARANTFAGTVTTTSKRLTLVFSTDGTFQRIVEMNGFTLTEADRQRLTIAPHAPISEKHAVFE